MASHHAVGLSTQIEHRSRLTARVFQAIQRFQRPLSQAIAQIRPRGPSIAIDRHQVQVTLSFPQDLQAS
jgi:hypothetical protein